jgi:hypothetical protein
MIKFCKTCNKDQKFLFGDCTSCQKNQDDLKALDAIKSKKQDMTDRVISIYNSQSYSGCDEIKAIAKATGYPILFVKGVLADV